MSDTSTNEKAYALRLPQWLYGQIEKLAREEMRSVNNMLVVLLREAVERRERIARGDATIEDNIETLESVAA